MIQTLSRYCSRVLLYGTAPAALIFCLFLGGCAGKTDTSPRPRVSGIRAAPGAEQAPPAEMAAANGGSASPGPGPKASAQPIRRSDVEDAVASDPDDFDLRMEAAAYFLQMGIDSAAIHDLQAAARLRPKSAEALAALADAESLAGQDATARTTYARVLAISPDNALAYRGLGQLLVREKKLSAARKMLETGLKKNPSSAAIQLALGNVYLVQHDNPRAVQELSAAAASSPDDADAHYLLALAQERNLHINAALREARKAVAIEPRMAEAWGAAGLYLMRLERYRESRTDLQKAIALSPRNSRFYQTLGDAYGLDSSDRANAGKAIQAYERSLSLNPHGVTVALALARVLAQRDRPEDRTQAVRLLQQVTRSNPKDAEAWYQLSIEDHRLGLTSEAINALRHYESTRGGLGQ